MNRRREFVRIFALDAIADDYEALETITRHVSRAGAQCGLAIQPTEIVQELLRLIELGWADVYYLSQWQRDANKIAGMPPTDQLQNYYYYISEAGSIVQAEEWADYPFDDNGEVRADWIPPED
jgi:hypothetical protein